MSVRCLVVDDNPGFLQIASKVLETGGVTVVGVASTSAEALWQAAQLDPDVALVDIFLGSESGLTLAKQLTETRSGRLCVILISTQAEEDFADLIEGSPAIAFLPKSRLSAAAITELLAGQEKSAGRA
jgi:CheY-like chemotaxis protein